MKMLNKKNIILVGMILLFQQQVQAEIISGLIKGERSSVPYKVNTETGEYSFDLKGLVKPQILIDDSSDQLDATCARTRKVIENVNGALEAKYYKFAQGKEVKIEFKLVDVNLDPISVETKIKEDLQKRNYLNVNLERSTRYFIEDYNIAFEWSSKAQTVIAKKRITEIAQEILRKEFNSRDFLIDLYSSASAVVNIPLIPVVCDLADEALNITLSGRLEIITDKKTRSPLSRQQLVNLNTYLLDNAKKLEVKIPKTPAFDEDTSKIVNSAALLGFGLAKQGFDSTIINSSFFENIFFRMFGFPSRMPKKLLVSEYEELEKTLTNRFQEGNDKLDLSNKKIKVEVLK